MTFRSSNVRRPSVGEILREMVPVSTGAKMLRWLIVWPLKVLTVIGTLMVARLFVHDGASLLSAFLLPLCYLVLMVLPVLLAEVGAWLMRRRWGQQPPQRAMVVWGALVFPLLGVASYAGFMSLPLWIFEVVPDILSPSPMLASLAMLPAGAITAGVLWRHWISKGILAQLDAAKAQQEVTEQARALAEARLSILQAQIEPHFLFNTLANVQYLYRKDVESGHFMLGQFIRYLRSAMPSMRTNTSTVEREMELVDAFLQMASIRMCGRLGALVSCAEDAKDLPFPPLVLQTLAENALIHGVEPKVGAVAIEVRATLQGQRLQIVVKDDGVGLGGSPNKGTGTGLKNIRERLASIYGRSARLIVTSQPDSGVMACIEVDTADSTKDWSAHGS